MLCKYFVQILYKFYIPPYTSAVSGVAIDDLRMILIAVEGDMASWLMARTTFRRWWMRSCTSARRRRPGVRCVDYCVQGR